MSTAIDLRLTNDDLECLPDDGKRYELIDGELYVSAAPNIFHQTVLMNIGGAFLDYLRRHPIGRVLPGVGVIFDDHNGVIPDLVFATHQRMRKAVAEGRFHAAPEIVIEILSPGRANTRRDRHIKRSLYAGRGVDEYWIVDPESRSVEVHRRNEGGDLLLETNVQQGDDLTSPILPGFAARVETLFL